MPNVAITENFGDLLDARVRRIYDKEYEENVKESMIPMLFGMESSTRNYEIVSGIGGMTDLQPPTVSMAMRAHWERRSGW